MWRKHTAIVRDKLGVSASFAPWTTKPGIMLRGVPNNMRFRDVIDVAWITRLSKTRPQNISDEDARKSFYVDYAAAVQRSPWGSAKTLTQGWHTLVLCVISRGHSLLSLRGATLHCRTVITDMLFDRVPGCWSLEQVNI
jgi:hypothetical protein